MCRRCRLALELGLEKDPTLKAVHRPTMGVDIAPVCSGLEERGVGKMIIVDLIYCKLDRGN